MLEVTRVNVHTHTLQDKDDASSTRDMLLLVLYHTMTLNQEVSKI